MEKLHWLAQLPFCQEKSLVNDMTVNAQNSNAFVAAPQTFGLDARPAMPAMHDNPHRRGTGDAGSLRHIMGLLLRRAEQGGADSPSSCRSTLAHDQ